MTSDHLPGFGEGQWNTSRKSFQSRSLAAQQRENQNEYSPESRSEKRHPRRGLVQVLHFLLWSLSTKYITSLWFWPIPRPRTTNQILGCNGRDKQLPVRSM
ncbi:uncharacterized protein [Canis lupus baileyi]|uniref:uncharacterized protein isoform X6 n=1 Tax=Canis lupus baileyi TaxID=143281 RepID=UPI003B972D3A